MEYSETVKIDHIDFEHLVNRVKQFRDLSWYLQDIQIQKYKIEGIQKQQCKYTLNFQRYSTFQDSIFKVIDLIVELESDEFITSARIECYANGEMLITIKCEYDELINNIEHLYIYLKAVRNFENTSNCLLFPLALDWSKHKTTEE